jgi:hypothetical protein
VTGASLKKAFDKNIKGYVFVSEPTTKLSIPGGIRTGQELFLLQTNLLFQIKIMSKNSFTLEIVFTDQDMMKRRLYFSGASEYVYSKDNIVKG